MTWLLELKNDSGRALTPYPVDVGPPPKRLEDPANTIAISDSMSIDTGGFNPAFVVKSLPQNPGVPNGFVIQFDFSGAVGELLVRTFSYPVTPDQDDGTPATQPTLIAEFPFTELKEGSYELTAGVNLQDFQLQAASGSKGGGCVFWPLLFVTGALAERLI